MNYSSRINIRLTRKLKNLWKSHIAENLGSRILRVFMRKVVDKVRTRPQNIIHFAYGQYDLKLRIPRNPTNLVHPDSDTGEKNATSPVSPRT